MINNRGHTLAFDDSPLTLNSPLDSVSYNKIIDSLKSSTLRCINRTRDLNNRVVKFNKALTAENLYITSKLQEQAIFVDNPITTSGTALITGFDTLIASSLVTQTTLTGQITIEPVVGRKWSKVVRYQDKNGRNRASKDIYISYGPVASPSIQPADSDIYSILDGYADTFWLADTVENTQYTLQIQFPTSLKPYVNYLSLIPFPAFSFNIDSVYITKADGSREQIADSVSQHMGILDVHFKPISWGGTITINFTSNGSVVGIADLDIGLVNYQDSQGYMVFEVPSFFSHTFSTIESIDLFDYNLYGIANDPSYIKSDRIVATAYQFSDGTVWSDVGGVDINRATLTGDGATVFSKTLTTNRFYLKITMDKYLGQSPIFRAIKITHGV